MTLKLDTYYEVTFNAKKKDRRVMLYRGQDLGRNHTFVSNKGMLKVADSQLENVNPVEIKKPNN